MSYQHIEVSPVSGTLGAEIAGVDLREELSDEVLAEIRQAWLEHLVLFFRDQELTPDQHKRFGQYFGELHVHPFIPSLEGHPEIIVLESLDTGPSEMAYQSNRWHTDLTYTAEPSGASILLGLEIPPAGGDTLFLSLYAAWESLSPVMQEALEGMVAVHDIVTSMPADFFAQSWAPDQLKRLQEKTPPVEHPVVVTHPDTGRKMLYVNSNFTSHIKGMHKHESDALLAMLFAHLQRPEHQVRFRWQPNSIAMWDNRCTQHYATINFAAKRLMHRVTLCGERPAA